MQRFIRLSKTPKVEKMDDFMDIANRCAQGKYFEAFHDMQTNVIVVKTEAESGTRQEWFMPFDTDVLERLKKLFAPEYISISHWGMFKI